MYMALKRMAPQKQAGTACELVAIANYELGLRVHQQRELTN